MQSWGCSRPGPLARPRDLIVLKQSHYLLFFQCPLYFLVSYLHKHWGTFGYSLCSSVDWLGISPMCRGSGLCSHLSCRHLPLLNVVIFFNLFVAFTHRCGHQKTPYYTMVLVRSLSPSLSFSISLSLSIFSPSPLLFPSRNTLPYLYLHHGNFQCSPRWGL